jgi:hypothetical protein
MGDQECENEAQSALDEAMMSTVDQMIILENQHK